MSDSESDTGSRARDSGKCRLGTDNYLEWAVRMQAKLIRKELWSVVEPDGEDELPEETPVAAAGTAADATVAEAAKAPAVKTSSRTAEACPNDRP